MIRAACLPALLGAVLLGDGACQAAAGPPSFRAALVVGNAHYTSAPALANPVNDAGDMCAALRSLGFQATCLTDVNSRIRLRSAIEDFVDSLPPGAVSVIYYAGHGLQVQGENYLLPTGARVADEAAVRDSAVSLSFVMRQLQRQAGYLTVVILDACRDNPLRHAGRVLPAGLAQITDIPAATQVVYATAANEVAADGSGRNGTFTRSLLAHLTEPGTVDDLFKKVSQAVQAQTAALGVAQRPALYTNFTGQFCFVQCDIPGLGTTGDGAGEARAGTAAGAAPAARKPVKPADSFVPPAL